MHSESQTAAVTIISYKPLSLLYTQDSVPYMAVICPLPTLGSISPRSIATTSLYVNM